MNTSSPSTPLLFIFVPAPQNRSEEHDISIRKEIEVVSSSFRSFDESKELEIYISEANNLFELRNEFIALGDRIEILHISDPYSVFSGADLPDSVKLDTSVWAGMFNDVMKETVRLLFIYSPIRDGIVGYILDARLNTVIYPNELENEENRYAFTLNFYRQLSEGSTIRESFIDAKRVASIKGEKENSFQLNEADEGIANWRIPVAQTRKTSYSHPQQEEIEYEPEQKYGNEESIEIDPELEEEQQPEPLTPEQLIERITFSSFQADSVDGKDQLGITPDVNAFANLMSSRELKPPLSIGLFGDWGSGKSFFMNKIRKGVEGNVRWVRQRAREAASDFKEELINADEAEARIKIGELFPLASEQMDELMDEIRKQPGTAFGHLSRLFGKEAESVIKQLSTNPQKAKEAIKEKLIEKRESLVNDLYKGLNNDDKDKIDIIRRLAEAKEANRLGYCQNISQIEFNAWHYIDTNLWASLITNILEDLNSYVGNLSTQDKEEIKLYQQLATTQELFEETQKEKAEIIKEKIVLEKELKQLEEEREIVRKDLTGINLKAIWGELKKEESVQSVISEVDTKVKEASDQLGFTPLKAEAEENWVQIKSLYEKYNSTRGKLSVWLKEFEAMSPRAKRLIFIFIVIPLLIIFGIPLIPEGLELPIPKGLIEGISKIIAVAFSLIKLIPGIVEKTFGVLKKVNVGVDALYSAKERIGNLENKASTEVNSQIAEKQKELDGLTQREQEIDAEIREIDKKLQKTEDEISAIQKGKRLSAFIEGRLTSNDYQQHLGLVSIIRNDFEKLTAYLKDKDYLSKLLSKANNSTETDLNPFLQPINKIDRIILYIDDLDRCPPEKVVEVLQAIHLILAFDLFVIVVGVDVRWISRSLIKQYGSMLAPMDLPSTHESSGYVNKEAEESLHYKGNATPFDYLEKIFQIPFRLKPMDSSAKLNYVSTLLESDVMIEPLAVEPSEEKTQESTSAETIATKADSKSAVIQKTPQKADEKPLPSKEEKQPKSPKQESLDTEVPEQQVIQTLKEEEVLTEEEATPPEPEILRQLERIRLSESELTFIKELTPILSSSPRSIKRFVNICRLIKSHETWGETPAKASEKLTSYEIMVFLLAIVAGTPYLAEVFFDEMEIEMAAGTGQSKTLKQFVEEVDAKLKDPDRELIPSEKLLEEWNAFYQIIFPVKGKKESNYAKELHKTFQKLSLNSLYELSDTAVRFSFRFEQY